MRLNHRSSMVQALGKAPTLKMVEKIGGELLTPCVVERKTWSYRGHFSCQGRHPHDSLRIAGKMTKPRQVLLHSAVTRCENTHGPSAFCADSPGRSHDWRNPRRKVRPCKAGFSYSGGHVAPKLGCTAGFGAWYACFPHVADFFPHQGMDDAGRHKGLWDEKGGE